MSWLLGVLLLAGVAGLAYRHWRREQAARASGLTVCLFQAGVPLTTLPLSVSVETLGGVSTVLIPRGAVLPADRSETFSTAADDQPSIEVHVLAGDRTLATGNASVGRFSITEIPPAPRGVPRFGVRFAVDSHGVFTFSATDRATGRRQPVSVVGSIPNPLSQATTSAMLEEATAEESKGEYGIPKTTTDALDSVAVYETKLRNLVENTRGVLKSRTDIAAAARKECEERVEYAERVLQANSQPQRASAKLNVLKADELVSAFDLLGEAAKRCQ